MSVVRPIVVDLGRPSDVQIEELRQGSGLLVEDIEEVMRLVRGAAGADGGNKIFLPIVAVYRRER
jgi:hypothetical protein